MFVCVLVAGIKEMSVYIWWLVNVLVTVTCLWDIVEIMFPCFVWRKCVFCCNIRRRPNTPPLAGSGNIVNSCQSLSEIVNEGYVDVDFIISCDSADIRVISVKGISVYSKIGELMESVECLTSMNMDSVYLSYQGKRMYNKERTLDDYGIIADSRDMTTIVKGGAINIKVLPGVPDTLLLGGMKRGLDSSDTDGCTADVAEEIKMRQV